jgi:hypothetical protein
MKELQRTIAQQCYNEVFKGNSKSSADQHQKCFNLYHGDPSEDDSIGIAKQLHQGLSIFAPLFEREANNAQGTAPLVLKSYYHCLDTEIIVSNETKHDGITVPILTATSLSNPQLLPGRAIPITRVSLVPIHHQELD